MGCISMKRERGCISVCVCECGVCVCSQGLVQNLVLVLSWPLYTHILTHTWTLGWRCGGKGFGWCNLKGNTHAYIKRHTHLKGLWAVGVFAALCSPVFSYHNNIQSPASSWPLPSTAELQIQGIDCIPVCGVGWSVRQSWKVSVCPHSPPGKVSTTFL